MGKLYFIAYVNECHQNFSGMSPDEVNYMKKCTGMTDSCKCFIYSQRIGSWNPINENYEWAYECLSEPVVSLSDLTKKKLGKILNVFADKSFLFSSKDKAIKAAKIIKVYDSLDFEEGNVQTNDWRKYTRFYVCLKGGEAEEV
jgi:hypothetical protein